MPSRIKSGPGECPKCEKLYTDLLDHITKRHQYDRFHQDEVVDAGLVVCVCGRVVRNRAGLMKHQSRYGCLITDQPTQTIQRQAVTAPTTWSSALTTLSSSLTAISDDSQARQSLVSPTPHQLQTTSATSSSLPTLTPSPARSQSSRTLGAQAGRVHQLTPSQIENWGSSFHSSLHPSLPTSDNLPTTQPSEPAGSESGWNINTIQAPTGQSRQESPEVSCL